MLKRVPLPTGKYGMSYYDHRSKVKVPENLQFDIATYGNYYGNSRSPGEPFDFKGALRIVTDFSETLSQEDRDAILQYAIDAHESLRHVSSIDGLINVVKHLANMTSRVFTRIQFAEKATAWVLANPNKVKITVRKDAGKRNHDTAESTFLFEDYVEGHAIAIFCKMVFPICGEIVNLVKRYTKRNATDSDLYPFGIMKKYLSREFAHFFGKMEDYHNRYIKNAVIDKMAAFRGVSPMSHLARRHAHTYVKIMVNENSYKEGGDLIAGIFNNITRAGGTNPRTDTSSGKLYFKESMLDKDSGDDEGGNVSDLEQAVSVFSEPTIMRPMMRVATETLVEKWIERNNIDPADFEAALNFYKRNVFAPNDASEIILGLFVGLELGSSWALKYSDSLLYFKLTICCQWWLDSYGFRNVVPLMVAKRTDIGKIDKRLQNALVLDKNARKEYRGVMEKMQHVMDYLSNSIAGPKFFDQNHGVLKRIEKAIIGYEMVGMVAPQIGDYAEISSADVGPRVSVNEDKHIQFTEKVLNDLYGAIYKLMILDNRDLLHIVQLREQEKPPEKPEGDNNESIYTLQ